LSTVITGYKYRGSEVKEFARGDPQKQVFYPMPHFEEVKNGDYVAARCQRYKKNILSLSVTLQTNKLTCLTLSSHYGTFFRKALAFPSDNFKMPHSESRLLGVVFTTLSA
jgi:hypothetical protein